MQNKDYHTSITVNASAAEAFTAINSVTKWWTENLEGSSQQLNDEFTVRFDDMHMSKQKLVEFIPNKKIVWLVTDSNLSFASLKPAWTGTKVSFEISGQGNKTNIDLTHIGLLPGKDWYDGCAGAWDQYIQSLSSLITTGKGQPDKKKKKTKQK